MSHMREYHLHSNISFDGSNTITELARAAVRAGLSEIAVTDHADIVREGELYLPYRHQEYYSQLLEAREIFNGELSILCGVEMGQGIHDKALAEEIFARLPYDFIIGSHHNIKDTLDFYELCVKDAAEGTEVMSKYVDELIETARWGRFCVLGHITYPLRYMKGRDGLDVSFKPFYDKLEILFRLLAENGLGIEVNTSGLRKYLGVTMPDFEIIKLYRACGGEIITVGSDAHTASEVGAGLAEGYNLLRAAGFKYVTAFKKLKPEFVKL